MLCPKKLQMCLRHGRLLHRDLWFFSKGNNSQVALAWLSLIKRCVMLTLGNELPLPSEVMNLRFNRFH